MIIGVSHNGTWVSFHDQSGAHRYDQKHTVAWPLLVSNQILRKTVPVTWAISSYIVPEIIKIRIGRGVIGTCNGHYGNLGAHVRGSTR